MVAAEAISETQEKAPTDMTPRSVYLQQESVLSSSANILLCCIVSEVAGGCMAKTHHKLISVQVRILARKGESDNNEYKLYQWASSMADLGKR